MADKLVSASAGRGRSRRMLLWLATIAVAVAGLELFSFALARIEPQLFDRRAEFLSTLQPQDFARFKTDFASRTLGWDNPSGRTLKLQNCAGTEITYTYNENHLRVHSHAPTGNAAVLIAGDSYTVGEEVEDGETFPATVERMLGVPVANLGVGGYGPDQALLKLEGAADLFPQARVAVLAIPYDDLRRMLNSYRPVLFGDTGVKFGLKPYVRNGQFQAIPGGDPFRDFGAFLAAANTAFDQDYWRRPPARLPYTAAAIGAAFAPANWYPALNEGLRFFGRPKFELLFSLAEARDGLRAIYERLVRFAQSRRLAAAVVFIPESGFDRGSGALGIAAATDAHRQAIAFLNTGRDFDWSRYRGPTCHPNRDGYRMIAEDVARAVRPLLMERTPPGG